MQTPNFFMIGFPKCGTTAMAAYLATNPQVYFSPIKEPFFWNTDFPSLQRINGLTTLEKYLCLFKDAGPQHLAVGEGCATYIYSSVAVPQILNFNPSARILVMLRNPVPWVQSYHHEQLFAFREDVTDFEVAWNLQTSRAQGKNLPDTPIQTVPKFLQYREMGSFASHLEPVIRTVPPDQLKIIILEEFIADPRKAYVEICQFLGVEDDGRTDFPPVRESQVHVWPALARLLRFPPKWLEPAAVFVRRLGYTTSLVGHAKRLLSRKKRRPAISADFEQHLRDTFEPEITRLEDLLGRRLDLWRTGDRASQART